MCAEHNKSNFIDTLCDMNSFETQSEQKKKRKLILHFYRELFKKEQVDLEVQDDVLDKVNSCLARESREKGHLSCTELAHAMKSMKSGKTPGEDGLTLEYYKAFVQQLLQLLTSLATRVLIAAVFLGSV